MDNEKQHDDVDFKVDKKDILSEILGFIVIVFIVGAVLSIINFFTRKKKVNN